MLIKEEFCTNGWADLRIMLLDNNSLNTIENAWISMVLLLQTIGACTAVHILTPGFVGASQGFWDLGGRLIYFQGSVEN